MVSNPAAETTVNTGKPNDRVSGNCSFIAGQIRNFVGNWSKVTSDQTILNTVEGYKLEFDSTPNQIACPNRMFTNANESQIVAAEIGNLLNKGVIHKVMHTEGEFLSNVFLRPKKALID